MDGELNVNDFTDAAEGDVDGPRIVAIFDLYRELPLLEWTSAENMRLNEDIMETLRNNVEEQALFVVHPQIFLKLPDNWLNIIEVAMNTTALRQFFMEQLIRHGYVTSRAFLPPRVEEDRWIACDVFREVRVIYTTESIQLIHEDNLFQVEVMQGVSQPYEALTFSEIVFALNEPFQMTPKPQSQRPDHYLHLVHDYDPLYFTELFNIPEKGFGTSLHYASPLLVHDILIHNQVVNIKKGQRGEEVVVAAVNAVLPSAGAPYRKWYEKKSEEASYLMEKMYDALSFKAQ